MHLFIDSVKGQPGVSILSTPATSSLPSAQQVLNYINLLDKCITSYIFPRTVFFHLDHIGGKLIKIILTALELKILTLLFSLKMFHFSKYFYFISS